MKKTNNIDELITQALNTEEAQFYHQLDEEDFQDMITGLFKGKLKWLTLLTTFFMLLIFAGGVYCAIRFFEVTTISEMLKWGGGVFISLSAVSMIKLMNWMQILTNSMSREIKRLELQIAILSNKLTNK